VTVQLDTGYGVLLFTALDGRPLSESARVLITAVARERASGAAYSDDDTQLLSGGGPPLLMEPVVAQVTLPGVVSVKALDVDGWPRVDVPVEAGSFTLDGRWRTNWYLAERPAPDDTGDTGGDAKDEGCGCAAGGTDGASALMLVAGLAEAHGECRTLGSLDAHPPDRPSRPRSLCPGPLQSAVHHARRARCGLRGRWRRRAVGHRRRR
jgi:hypothetical protein